MSGSHIHDCLPTRGLKRETIFFQSAAAKQCNKQYAYTMSGTRYVIVQLMIRALKVPKKYEIRITPPYTYDFKFLAGISIGPRHRHSISGFFTRIFFVNFIK